MIDPIRNAPVRLAVTEAQDRAKKLRTTLEGTAVTTATMVFLRITAIILAGLSVQYVVDGLAVIGLGTL